MRLSIRKPSCRKKASNILGAALWLSLVFVVNAWGMPNDPFGFEQVLGLTNAGEEPGSGRESLRENFGSSQNIYSDAKVQKSQVRGFNYSNLPESDVFGTRLFSGAFSRGGPVAFNPDYILTTGDKVHIRLWGAYQFDSSVTVDPKGNVFLPNVGPVKLAGIQSKDIQRVVDESVRKVYQKNVLSYASLEAAQPVRVFVSGFVRRPGLYDGTSMDSLLHYLDQAGGVDPDRGSFLDVRVKRGKKIRTRVSLYDFLLGGTLSLVQFTDGDVIFVGPRKDTVKVGGLVENSNRFEFTGDDLTLDELIRLSKPFASTTHVRVIRNTGTVRNVEFFSLEEVANVVVHDGDEVEFVADKKPGTITVRIEGEHESPQEYVLPYGSVLGDLLSQVIFSERSATGDLQLFRRSVKERQKVRLKDTLRGLENAVLTARSGTSDEARLRNEEASLIMQWVERAKQIEPLGQVIITQKADRDQLLLENGDIVRVPAKDGLVVVGGEVLFPTAIAFNSRFLLDDYINTAGGFSQNADSSRVILAHRDGTFEEVNPSKGLFQVVSQKNVREGDEILVLPKVDVKSRQIVKDMSQILYQIAISAKVVLGL